MSMVNICTGSHQRDVYQGGIKKHQKSIKERRN